MYIISSSNKRREFESLKDAMAEKSETDTLFVSDAFGNCTQMSDEQIQSELAKEEAAKPTEAPIQKVETAPAAVQTPQPTPTPKPEAPNKALVWMKYIMIAAIIIVVAYMIITFAMPALDSLMGIWGNLM